MSTENGNFGTMPFSNRLELEHNKWWFGILVADFIFLMWLGARPAEEPYASLALIGATYWFAYFLVILPLLGVIEKPSTPPATIEDDFNTHYVKSDAANIAAPAE